MHEVEINVEDDYSKVGTIIHWLIANEDRPMRGRIDYQGIYAHRSRFRFSNLNDAIFFKLAWG